MRLKGVSQCEVVHCVKVVAAGLVTLHGHKLGPHAHAQ